MTDKEKYFAAEYAELFRTRDRLIWLIIAAAVLLVLSVCMLIRHNTDALAIPVGGFCLAAVLAVMEAVIYHFQKKRIEKEENEWEE